MKKEMMVQLIDFLHAFEIENQDVDNYTMADFIGYLNAKLDTEKIQIRKIEGAENEQIQGIRQESNSDISILITLMFRYAKNYIKKALQGSTIQTADEFVYLITLMTHESLTKTELINKQVMEITSGVEVIKRLLAQKMITEFADKQDKRSVRVAITNKGKEELGKVLPKMAMVSKIVVGNLSQAEINTLAYLLKKLDYYHNDIFINKKNIALEDILGQSDDLK